MPEHRDTYGEPDYLSIGAAANRLGVSIDTIRRWDREGKLVADRTPGGQRRFRRQDVDALLTPPPADPPAASR